MKRPKLIVMALGAAMAAMALLQGCGGGTAGAASDNAFALGADISWVTEMEARGQKFYNAAGEETDCFALMKELGLNAVRLRVWVDPTEHGGWCDKRDLLVKARRTADLGMDIMVDFHYSDWWADPAKQNIPAAWKDYDYEQMKAAVAEHTKDVLQLLKDNGLAPKWVQVGNETSDGFLWDMGKASANPEQYAGLFAAGYEAVKEIFPEAIVIVHLDNGFDSKLYDWNLDILRDKGAKWDMIGMSLYPYWAMDAGREENAEQTITDCIANIRYVAGKYGCDVMIVETGMECAGDNGFLLSEDKLDEGKVLLERIIRESMDATGGHCRGVFYWEPECRPDQYRLGAFDETGRPTAIMKAFSGWRNGRTDE